MAISALDQDWITRLKGTGAVQERAIEELRQILVRSLGRSLAERGGGHAFAEDIAQETLLKVLSNLDQYEGRSRFTTWACSIGIRLGISELRRKFYRNIPLDESLAQPNWAKDSGVSVDADAGKREAQRNILGKLKELIDNGLTEKQRSAIQYGLAELPLEQIAERLGSNRNAIYKLLFDVRQKLKDGLERAGFTGEEILEAFDS